MPTLNLFTNLPVDGVVASDILKDATKAVSKIIGKPESYVMILLNGSVPIAFAGTEEPAAYGELISIGGIGPGVNGKLSSTIAEILETKLSIDSSRFYIKFYDVESNLSPHPRIIPLLLCFPFPESKQKKRINSNASPLPQYTNGGGGDAISQKGQLQHFSKKLCRSAKPPDYKGTGYATLYQIHRFVFESDLISWRVFHLIVRL